MGHVFTYHDAQSYSQWLKDPRNRSFAALENRLMFSLMRPLRGESILDIGCGTGLGMLASLENGLQASGLDPSPHMLEIAFRNVRNRADLHRGQAEDLPFEDNAFAYACLMNTLEFTENPRKALEEAFRVTKDRVFIGIINRHSLKAAGLSLGRKFVRSIYSHATFFTVWEIREMVRSLAGDVPVIWQSACQFPRPFGRYFKKDSYFDVIYHYPFGPFTGLVVSLVPRFKIRPLRLKKTPKPASGILSGLAATQRRRDHGSLSL
ncbi:class I SAM-dependent methyltransferase [Desulfonema ishimotonii]|uniref:Class I SAM-dependent methyltransferase n=1 Tax=Desulfonema ishimotonii TaxID=45657 RepID=A0A401G2A7_9BACT|nr:class I SAM-dependent methyltransferase [Desulfonema ishimotonii]GBC63313.1 class I SAM-dependent methyltransferase [Desulfonema ishimotonii]